MSKDLDPFSSSHGELPLLPDYTMLRQLGKGGFGVTFLAQESNTKTPYVIKQLCFERVENWKSIELFEREARVLQELEHPRIPAFKDLIIKRQEEREDVVLIQEYIEGENLETHINNGLRLNENEVVQLGLQMAEVLDYLHTLTPHVIHRDIKPANIILKPNREAYLVDFGAVRDQVKATRGSTIIGTFGYMAPEQYDGRAYPATDIYALGVSLIFALTHTEPGDMEKEQFKLLYRPHGQISHRLSLVLDKMISPDWKERYQSASELRKDLSDFLSGHYLKNTPQLDIKKISTLNKTAFIGGLSLIGFLFFWFKMALPSQYKNQSKRHQTLSETKRRISVNPDMPQALQRARWQGNLKYDGQLLNQFEDKQVKFWFRNEKNRTQISYLKGHYYKGHVWFSSLPEIRLLINVIINANPNGYVGDFEVSQTFNIFNDTPYTLNFNLYKTMHLISPEENMNGLPLWGSGKDKEHLPLWPAPVLFAWKPLGKDVLYKYKVELHKYEEGKYLKSGTLFDDSTKGTKLNLQLPPTQDHEYYIFKLSAYGKNGRIGLLVTHGETGGKGWDYRFRVE